MSREGGVVSLSEELAHTARSPEVARLRLALQELPAFLEVDSSSKVRVGHNAAQGQQDFLGDVGARFASALRAERVAIMEEMERRHAALLLELGLQPMSLEQQAPPSSLKSSDPEAADNSLGTLEPTEVKGDSPEDSQPVRVRNPSSLRVAVSDLKRMQEKLQKATGCQYVCLRLRYFIFGYILEIILAVLIIMNAVMVAVDAQHKSFDTGYELHLQGVWPDESSSRGKDVWPGAEQSLNLLEYFFGIVFTMEVVLKLGFGPKRFVTALWCWFDAVIVGAWILSLFDIGLGLNPMLLRVLRLIKLLRLLRLVKTVQVFDILRLLIGCLKASYSVFLWSLTILLCIIVFGALVLNYALVDYMTNVHNEANIRKAVFERFGSFSRAVVTMFELTLGNWHPPLRLLQQVNEWWIIPCLVYIVVVWFAVMQVIRAVYIQETFKVAASDDEMMIMQKNRLVRKHIENMDHFFREADESGDGFLSFEEFQQITQDVRVKTWMAAMEFDISNAQLVFDLLDDGDHKLSAQELVQGVAKLKGGARSIDLMALKYLCETIDNTCKQIENNLKKSGPIQAFASSPPQSARARSKRPMTTV